MGAFRRWLVASTVLICGVSRPAVADQPWLGSIPNSQVVIYAILCCVLLLVSVVSAGIARTSLRAKDDDRRPASARVLGGALWTALAVVAALSLVTLLVFAAGTFYGFSDWTLRLSMRVVGTGALILLLVAATVFAAVEGHYALAMWSGMWRDRQRMPPEDRRRWTSSVLLTAVILLVATLFAFALIALLVEVAGLSEGPGPIVTAETVRSAAAVAALALGALVFGWLLIMNLLEGDSLSIESNWGGIGGGLGGWRVSASVGYLLATLAFGGALAATALQSVDTGKQESTKSAAHLGVNGDAAESQGDKGDS